MSRRPRGLIVSAAVSLLAAFATVSAPGVTACSLHAQPLEDTFRFHRTILLASATDVDFQMGERFWHADLRVERLIQGEGIGPRFSFDGFKSDCLSGAFDTGDRVLLALGEPLEGGYPYHYWTVGSNGSVESGYRVSGLYEPDPTTLRGLLRHVERALPETSAAAETVPGVPSAPLLLPALLATAGLASAAIS